MAHQSNLRAVKIEDGQVTVAVAVAARVATTAAVYHLAIFEGETQLVWPVLASQVPNNASHNTRGTAVL